MCQSQKEYYESLLKSVEDARQEVKKQERFISVHHKQALNLDRPLQDHACINIFDKVCFAHTQDDTGATISCDLFRSDDSCTNRKCPMFALHMDYVVACDRYRVAKSNLENFFKQLDKKTFKSLTKEIREARKFVYDATQKIINHKSQIDLNDEKISKSCVNVCDENIATNNMESPVGIYYCEVIRGGDKCSEENCAMFSNYTNYMTASENLDMARKMRRIFVKRKIVNFLSFGRRR